MYRISHLDNGLRVATSQMPHMASVSLGIWVGVGGRYEPAALNGASHFIEHMLFKGTRRRTARAISQAVEGIGGYLNAFTGEENTCFYAKAHSDHLEEMLDVLMDMFLHSSFDSREIEKERRVIKEELAMYLDQPHQHVQELLNQTLWPDHSLGRPLTGTERTIDALDRRKLLQFRRGNYVASRTLVTAAGNLRHHQLVRAVAPYMRRFVTGARGRFDPVSADQAEPWLRLHPKDTAQMQLALGFRTCSRHDDRRFPLRLLNTLLGENMSSRLFQVLREDYGLAYSIHSGISFLEDTGALVISAGLETDQLARALKLIFQEIRRFRERPPGAREFRQARDYLIGQLDLGLESTENQMMWLGDQLLFYGKVISPSEIKRRLSSVKPAEVREVARAFFRPEGLSLAVVSPLKAARAAGLKRLIHL